MNNRGIQKVVLSRDRAAPYNKNKKQLCTQILLADRFISKRNKKDIKKK